VKTVGRKDGSIVDEVASYLRLHGLLGPNILKEVSKNIVKLKILAMQNRGAAYVV